MNCTEKFVKHSERVGARFAELNAGAFKLAAGPRSHLIIFLEMMGGNSTSLS